jgi:hypothetical protein
MKGFLQRTYARLEHGLLIRDILDRLSTFSLTLCCYLFTLEKAASAIVPPRGFPSVCSRERTSP